MTTTILHWSDKVEVLTFEYEDQLLLAFSVCASSLIFRPIGKSLRYQNHGLTIVLCRIPEDNSQSRGSHLIHEDKINSVNGEKYLRRGSGLQLTSTNDNVAKSYFMGIRLCEGSKISCVDFIDKTKRNLEMVAVSNQDSRV